MSADADLFAGASLQPIPRGKARDSFTLSEPGRATGHLWEGAVRSGKTVVSIIRWLLFVLFGPPGNLLMIGKTQRTLQRNVLDEIIRWLGPKRAKLNMGEGHITICGRRVYLAGANDEGAVARIQGLTLVGFYGDEISTWPETVFDMARTRLSSPGAEWFGTSNPGPKLHFLNVNVILRAKLHLQRSGRILRRRVDAINVHVYSFKLTDNPYLTEQYIAEQLTLYKGLFRKRYIDGEWCMAEGAIYDMFDESKHVIPWADIPQLDEWLGVGVDQAIASPTHAVAVGIGPAPYGRPGLALYVTDELRRDPSETGRRSTDLEHAEAIRDWLADLRHPGSDVRGLEPPALIVDTAAAGLRVQLAQLGLYPGTADKDVVPGIADVASLYGAMRLYIADTCPRLIEETPGYAWNPKKSAEGLDEPIKMHDHGLDAERYILRTTRGQWRDLIFPPSDASLGMVASAA